MARSAETDKPARREYAQLLRIHERMLAQLQRLRDELDAPSTVQLVRDIRKRTGDTPGKRLSEVTSAVEEAMRALLLSESDIQNAVLDEPVELAEEGIPNLPASLARFLAERKELPGFSYEVDQDEVRGWVIRWKEYTPRKTVRGYGQFYERPYAWLED